MLPERADMQRNRQTKKDTLKQRDSRKLHKKAKDSKNPKKKDKYPVILLYAAIAVIAATAIAVYLVRPAYDIEISGIETADLPGEGVLLSFSVTNQKEAEMICTINAEIRDSRYSWDIGLLAPGETLDVHREVQMPQGRTYFRLKAECRPSPGCSHAPDARTKQCMERVHDDKYFCIGFLTKNDTYCHCIQGSGYRQLCLAYLNNDASFCESLSEERDWCFLDFALNRADEDVCRRVRDISMRSACLAVINKDLELCTSLPEGEKFSCIVHLAPKLNNKSLCSLVEDSEACMEELAWMR